MAEQSPFDREAAEPRRRPEEQRDEGDTILRSLIGMDPAAFLKLVGGPTTGPVRLIDAGVFPHVIPIDKVLRVTASKPRIVVIGLAASHDPTLVDWLQTTVVSLLHHAPIEPIVMLVRPEADDPTISGERVVRLPSGREAMRFNYRVLRAWEHPPDLAFDVIASPGLAWIKQSGLPALVARLRERATRGEEDAASESVTCLVFALPERGPVDSDVLAMAARLELMAACVLLSLGRSHEPRIVSRHEGCAVMRLKLFQRGTSRFGAPDERVASEIGAIASPRRLTDLDNLLARIDGFDLPITGWDELLAWGAPGG